PCANRWPQLVHRTRFLRRSPEAHRHLPQSRDVLEAFRARDEMRLELGATLSGHGVVGVRLAFVFSQMAMVIHGSSTFASARRARQSCARAVPAAIPVICAISSCEYPSTCNTNTVRAPFGRRSSAASRSIDESVGESDGREPKESSSPS